MLKNAENIALQNLPILYTFVLQAEVCTTFDVRVVRIFRPTGSELSYRTLSMCSAVCAAISASASTSKNALLALVNA